MFICMYIYIFVYLCADKMLWVLVVKMYVSLKRFLKKLMLLVLRFFCTFVNEILDIFYVYSFISIVFLVVIVRRVTGVNFFHYFC